MSSHKFDSNFTSFWYCGGVILFNYAQDKVLIVETASKNIGFTKGKKEKGETLLETAHREVSEESGYFPDEYHHDETIIGERKSSRGPSIYYFVGTLNSPELEYKKITFNPLELEKVYWCSIEKAHEILCLRRKEVLETALEILNK